MPDGVIHYLLLELVVSLEWYSVLMRPQAETADEASGWDSWRGLGLRRLWLLSDWHWIDNFTHKKYTTQARTVNTHCTHARTHAHTHAHTHTHCIQTHTHTHTHTHTAYTHTHCIQTHARTHTHTHTAYRQTDRDTHTHTHIHTHCIQTHAHTHTLHTPHIQSTSTIHWVQMCGGGGICVNQNCNFCLGESINPLKVFPGSRNNNDFLQLTPKVSQALGMSRHSCFNYIRSSTQNWSRTR